MVKAGNIAGMTIITPHNAATAVGLANSAFTAVKSAFELAKKTTDLELKHEISATFESVLELKVKVYELAEENRSLRELLDQKASIKRDPQFGYWFKEGETEPLCPKCYEGKNAIVYLSPLNNYAVGGLRRWCHICEKPFPEKAAKRPQAVTLGRGFPQY